MLIRRSIPVLTAVLLAACGRNEPVTPTPLQRAAVSGGEIEYRVAGNGEPVLLIHGSAFADAFEPLMPEPALSGFRLINYHRRGYMRSSRVTAPFTIAQQTADAIALLDRLDIRKAHIVGHSYGGAIGLQLAASHPERVATLVLLEPAIFEMTPATQALFAAAGTAFALHAKGDDRAALAHFSNAVVAPNTWESMAAQGGAAAQDQAVKDAGTFFDVEMPALQEWKFTFDDVAKLRVPVLAIVGGASTASARETHAAIRRVLPQSEAVVIEGATHELQMSRPGPVAEGIAAFLRRHRM